MGNSRAGLVYGAHSACLFLGAGGGGTFDRQRGFAAANTRNGAGDYTLNLTDAIDATPSQNYLLATTMSGAAAMIDAVIATATTIRVRTFSGANAATDMLFALEVRDFGVN